VREHIERVRGWREQNRPSLPSTVGLERRINPFLRAGTASVRHAAEAHAGTAQTSEIEAFATLRRWKDGFRG